MADPLTASQDEAQSWDYAPTNTPVADAISAAGNPDVSPEGSARAEAAAITYDPQQARAQAQQQAQQDKAEKASYRVTAQDLTRRGVGYYTDLNTGAPQTVNDESGSPLTNFDRSSQTGYDSQGNPRTLKFNAQTGQPELHDPYEGAPQTTDKQGNIYTAPKGLPWRFDGVNPDIAQQNQDTQQAKLDAQTATALTSPVAMAKTKFSQMQQAVDGSEKSTAATLQKLGVPTTDEKGIPLDLTNADPNELRKTVANSFDAELKDPSANEKQFFGSGLTASAQALRQDIQNRQKQAQDALENHFGVVSAMQQAGSEYDQTRAPLAAINVARINRLNDQRQQAGLAPIAIPAELQRVAALAAPPAIPGMDHAGNAIVAAAPQPAAPAQQPAAPPSPAQPQGPQSEGALQSFLRPLESGIVPAIGAAAGGVGGAALAGVLTSPSGPGAIASAIAGDIAGGALGGGLAQKAQNAIMGGDWTKENQAQMEANMKEHPIASKIGGFIPAIISMLGGGGGKAVRGTVDAAGAAIPGATQQIAGAVEGWLGRSAAQVAEHPAYLAKAISSLPEMMTVGARMGAASAAQQDITDSKDFANVVPEAIKGAVTMGPTAFVPMAGTMLGSLFGKAPADAAILATSNALYDKLIKGKDVDFKELATNIGTDIPGFMLMNALSALAHRPLGPGEKGPAPEAKGPPEPPAPEPKGAPHEPPSPSAEPAGKPEQSTVEPAPAPAEKTPAPIVGPALLGPNGEILHRGQLGQSHADLIREAAQSGVDATNATHGFYDANGDAHNRVDSAYSALANGDIDQATFNRALARQNEPGLHTEDLQPQPTQTDALQEPQASGVFQREQSQAGETGGGRGRVEQGEQGTQPARAGKEGEAVPISKGIAGLEHIEEPTKAYEENAKSTHAPITDEQRASTQKLLDSPEAKEVIDRLNKLKGVKFTDEAEGRVAETTSKGSTVNIRALAHSLDALETPEAKAEYVRNALDEELKHQASTIAVPREEAKAIGKSLTAAERSIVENLYGAKMSDEVAGHEAIRAFMQGAEGHPTEAFQLFTEKARTDSKFREAIRKVLNLLKQLATKPGALSDRLTDGIRKTQEVLDRLEQNPIAGMEHVEANEAPKIDPKIAKLREAHEQVKSELQAARDALQSGFGDEDTPGEIRSLEAREKALREKLAKSSPQETKSEIPKGAREVTLDDGRKIHVKGEGPTMTWNDPTVENGPGGGGRFNLASPEFRRQIESAEKASSPPVETVEPPSSGEAKAQTEPEERAASEEAPKATEAAGGKFVEGAKVRVGSSPQLRTIIEKQEPIKGHEDENYFTVKNYKTGETQTVQDTDMQPVKERSAEEKKQAAATREQTEAKIDARLREHKLDPNSLPDLKSKRAALKRAEALGAAEPEKEYEHNQSAGIAGIDKAQREIEQSKFDAALLPPHDGRPEEAQNKITDERAGSGNTGTPAIQSASEGRLGASAPESDQSAKSKEEAEAPSKLPANPPAHGETSAKPNEERTPSQRLIDQADAHDIPYSLETLKGLIRGEPAAMDKMRAMIRDKGETPLGASPVQKMKDLIDRHTPGLDLLKSGVNGIKSLMLPSSLSPEHLAEAEGLGARLGEAHRRQEVDIHVNKADAKTFDKMGVGNEKTPIADNPGMKFMSAMATGKPLPPLLDAVRNKLDGQFKSRLDLMDKAGVPLEKVRENYFPGMWTEASRNAFNRAYDEAIQGGKIKSTDDINNLSKTQKDDIKARVDQLMQGADVGPQKYDAVSSLAKRPFEGKASFRKAKVFDDVMTGAELGLKPVFTNPIEMANVKLGEMDRFITAHQRFDDLKKEGKLIALKPNGEPMKGFALPGGFDKSQWTKLPDKYGDIFTRDPDTHMLQKVGERWVTKPVGDVLGNYLSSSLYNNRYFGGLYKSWMGVANLLNQAQLGVGSMFHAGFTAMESQVSAAANVIKDAFGVLRGNRTLGDFGKTLAKLPVAVPENLMTGDKLLNAWRDPKGVIDPKMQKLARAYELGGGAFKMEKGLTTEQSALAYRDWFGGNKLRAAARSPVAAVEMMAKPIMDYLVPRQKAGVFAHLAQRIIDTNPGKSMEELTPEFRQAVNRVDARLGQVGYDRLFANNTAKNVVQALVRAPGWTGGTIAELGGGFKDAAKFMKEWASTGKMPKDIPDRLAYSLGLVITGAVMNGAITYAMTGKAPSGTDFIAFRTGKKDEQGNDERFMLPSYLKDLWAYSQYPGQTVLNKAHPLIGMVSQLAQNRDYYGTEIRNPDSSAAGQAAQTGKFVVKQFEPFWVRGEQKEAERRSGTLEKALPMIGVTPAPKEMNQSKAERLATEISRERMPSLPSTEQQTDRRLARSQATIALRQGDTSVLQKELSEGKLKPSDVRSIQQIAANPPIVNQVKSLPLEQAERVFKLATPQERIQLNPVMAAKRSRAATTGKPYQFK